MGDDSNNMPVLRTVDFRGRRRMRNYEDFSGRAEGALQKFPSDYPSSLQDKAYSEEYDYLLDFFAARTASKKWDAANVRIAALAIYGWMPTILRVYGRGKFDDNVEMVDFSEIAHFLNENTIDGIESNWLNNSYVGTSKFLHFYCPEEFAIWDSRICEALGWGAYPNCANDKSRFEDYQRFMRQFCAENRKSMRKLELALFSLNRTVSD